MTPFERTDFKVPVGSRPDGNLVRAAQATADVPYHCPGCRSPLILRKGEVRAAHFAHGSHAFCSPETALHLGVKHWIARLLEPRLRGVRKGIPRLQVPCSGQVRRTDQGSRRRCAGEAWLSLADLAFDEIAVEAALEGGLKPDILLCNHGTPVLGIEVLVSHAVDPGKAARSSHPWVEVDALQIVRAPRSWRPAQMAHPWTAPCRICQWASQIQDFETPEWGDPGEYAAQLAAAFSAARLQEWLGSRSRRFKPVVLWRCPWCRHRNQRPIRKERFLGAGLASSLLPPCPPEVILQAREGPSLSIRFGFPLRPERPWLITSLEDSRRPSLRVTPDPRHPHRLGLNGTNRPVGFACGKCGGDCLGLEPWPGVPVPFWEALTNT